jgi:tetratricopeptide (TPR) repeat protein
MIRRLLLLACLAFAPLAGAQVLEDVEVSREGASDARITIGFAVRVQYLRMATNTKKDLVQIFFRITQSETDGRTVEEFRRPPTNGLVPRFTVTYPVLQSGDRRLDIQFEKPVEVRVRPGPDNRAILVITPALAPAAQAPPAAPARPSAPAKPAPPAAAPVPAVPPAVPTEPPEAARPLEGAAAAETIAKAQKLLSEARAALDTGRTDEAVELLNELLNLPPTEASREAQELIGVAREKRGEPDKARVEYELFLKLYPTGADVQRVRSRLAALGPAKGAPPPAEPAEAPAARPARFLAWGSVSQYYYGGQSQTQSTVTTVTPATNATTIDTLSLSSTDQKALVTNVDLNARYTSASWDDRVVFRDTQTYSFLKEQPNRNRLVAAYAEASNLPAKLMVRLGRQSSTFGGVLGRFDGIQASSYGFAQGYRANLVAGRPADRIGDLNPWFYGASLDADALGERLSGTFYAIQQRVQGQTDRTALGAEVRYFDTERSMVSLVDYDVTFGAMNIAMLQGTWQLPGGTSLNFLGDYRRSPSLQLSNALLTGRNLTLAQYLETFGESQTRDDARAITPISKVFYVGMTTPITQRWQVGADFRLSSLSGTPEIGLLPATVSTGNVYTYSAQVIGSGLFGRNDVMVLNASYLTGTLNRGTSLGITERVQVGELVVVEPSFRYYRQTSSNEVRLTRLSPGLKLSYKLRERMQLEGEATWERTHTTSPTVDDTTTRVFYFVGYRWDF